MEEKLPNFYYAFSIVCMVWFGIAVACSFYYLKESIKKKPDTVLYIDVIAYSMLWFFIYEIGFYSLILVFILPFSQEPVPFINNVGIALFGDRSDSTYSEVFVNQIFNSVGPFLVGYFGRKLYKRKLRKNREKGKRELLDFEDEKNRSKLNIIIITFLAVICVMYFSIAADSLRERKISSATFYVDLGAATAFGAFSGFFWYNAPLHRKSKRRKRDRNEVERDRLFFWICQLSASAVSYVEYGSSSHVFFYSFIDSQIHKLPYRVEMILAVLTTVPVFGILVFVEYRILWSTMRKKGILTIKIKGAKTTFEFQRHTLSLKNLGWEGHRSKKKIFTTNEVVDILINVPKDNTELQFQYIKEDNETELDNKTYMGFYPNIICLYRYDYSDKYLIKQSSSFNDNSDNKRLLDLYEYTTCNISAVAMNHILSFISYDHADAEMEYDEDLRKGNIKRLNRGVYLIRVVYDNIIVNDTGETPETYVSTITIRLLNQIDTIRGKKILFQLPLS